MTTITDFRSMARSLYGTDPTTDRGYVDAVLDRSIKQAVSEFSQYLPVKATASVNVTGGSRSWDMAAALTRPAAAHPCAMWCSRSDQLRVALIACSWHGRWRKLRCTDSWHSRSW